MRNPLSILPKAGQRPFPFRSSMVEEAEDPMERWFQSNFELSRDFNGYDFSPSCDFSENEMEFQIQLDIPGVKKRDLKIELEDNRLIISGERAKNSEKKSLRHIRSESYYGSFMRVFNFPTAIKENKIDAHFENGVLKVTIPKVEVSKSQLVEIH